MPIEGELILVTQETGLPFAQTALGIAAGNAEMIVAVRLLSKRDRR
jgi:hypothetical protein